MKLRNKIIVVISCLAVLVSSFCISSFAYSTSNDNNFNLFPSASFVAYNSNGTVKTSSCTVRTSSTNTGDSSSSVRSVWSRSTVDQSRNVSLLFGSYNSTSLTVTDFYYPIYITGNSGDISIDVSNYAGLSGSYGVESQYSYQNIYVKIGFYYFNLGDAPLYYERQVSVSSVPDYDPSYSMDPISVYNLINFEFDFDSAGTYCLVDYIYISGSNLFIYDDGTNDPVNGAFAGSVSFFDTESIRLGFDASQNNQYGVDCIGEGYRRYGYHLGYDSGYDYGYDVGSNDGYDIGYIEGSSNLDGPAYDIGYEDGYDVGYTNGSSDLDGPAYKTGYSDGYSDGSEDTYGPAYNEGFDVGYADGLKDGEEIASPENWFDGIIGAVSSFLNIDIFGTFSFGDMLYVIIGFSLFMWILKVFGGG